MLTRALCCAVIDGFSESFLHEFLEHLRRSHPHSRVAAKIVYIEYIANRHHVHMNSTKWLTLTGAERAACVLHSACAQARGSAARPAQRRERC